jgi:hypothetical protein
MEAESKEIAEPKNVTIVDQDLKLLWGLICTREWPTDFIPQLSHLKNVVSNVLRTEDGKVQSSDEG